MNKTVQNRDILAISKYYKKEIIKKHVHRNKSQQLFSYTLSHEI